MSDFTTAARPYARAVYQQALESKTIPQWSDALSLLAAVTSDETILEIIDDPQLNRNQKGDQVLAVVGDKLSAQQKNLVKLMAENGRLSIIPEVAAQYEVFCAEAEGKVDAEVISAFALTEEQERTIVETLKTKLGREVSITTAVDESLIGGVVIKAGDTIIDGSMKAQLESLSLSLNR